MNIRPYGSFAAEEISVNVSQEKNRTRLTFRGQNNQPEYLHVIRQSVEQWLDQSLGRKGEVSLSGTEIICLTDGAIRQTDITGLENMLNEHVQRLGEGTVAGKASSTGR